MTSREQSIQKIEECASCELIADIEKAIGGNRDWRETKWGDGKARVSFRVGRFPESLITSICNSYIALGWTITRSQYSDRLGDSYEFEQRVKLSFE